MSIEILDCLKRKRDIGIKNIIPSQNTAFRFSPALTLRCLPISVNYIIFWSCRLKGCSTPASVVKGRLPDGYAMLMRPKKAETAVYSPLQKRERTGTSFLYWLDWKSKHFNWNVTEWKATQPSLRVFSWKLFKWENLKSCKIPYKSL